MFHPSKCDRCWEIQRNVKWRSNVNVNWWIIDVSLNFSASSDYRKMKHSSLVSSHHDESNGSDFILLSEMKAKIFNKNCIEKFTNLIHIESNYIQIQIKSDYIQIQIRSVWIKFEFRSVQFRFFRIQIRLDLIIFEFRSVLFRFYSDLNQIRF